MTSTSTPRAGLSRLLNSLAAAALLLVVAGGASAQTGRTIFVDANGGADSNNGQNPRIDAGVNGPVETIQRAIQLARQDAQGNTISIEAGDYDAEVNIVNNAGDLGGAASLSNLTFLARPDQDGNTQVNLISDFDDPQSTSDDDDDDETFLTAVPGFRFASQGGGRFVFMGDGVLDFQDGSVNFGTGVVVIDGIDVVERTNAAVAGTVQYGLPNSTDALPNVIRFNGDGNVTAGTLLPSVIDASQSEGDVLIDIALGSVATVLNDNARTFTLGAGGLTLGDDGSNVTLRVRDGNTILGDIRTIDGSGANGTADVVIEGEGSIGDLIVDGARTEYDLDEGDDDGENDNSAASITVRAGELNFDDDDDDDETVRYLVTGDFRQTGGIVTADDDADEVILVVQGDFRRTDNTRGNFAQINVYLEGTADADFAPGTNLVLNSVHINATPNSATNRKMVLFLQDITVNSGATVDLDDQDSDNIIPFIVTGDAEVDLNGNLVNIVNGGRSLVLGTVSDSDNSGAVRFTNGGIVSGNGIYSSIIVSGDDDVDAEDDVRFTGALLLLGGGIDVEDGGDISPLGNNASVVVNVAADFDDGDGAIEGDVDGIGDGTFNEDGVEYDLIYQDTESQDVDEFIAGSEFDTSFIRDLTVDVTDTEVVADDDNVNVDADGDGSISGDLIVRDGRETDGATTVANPDEFGALVLQGIDLTVEGTTLVESYARIRLNDSDGDDDGIDDDDDRSTLTVNGANIVRGAIGVGDDSIDSDAVNIDGIDDLDDGFLILTDGASINGDGGVQSLLGRVVLANEANATITDIVAIAGTVTDTGDAALNDDSSLTLGLRTRAANVAAGESTAGDVFGDIVLNDSDLTLTTTAEFFGDAIIGGVLTLGTNDFVFNTSGDDDTNDATDNGNDLRLFNNVSASTGAIQFVGPGDDDEPDFFGGNVIVPNVGIFTDTDLLQSVRISNTFRLYADLQDTGVADNPATPVNEDTAVTLLDGATIALGDGGQLDDGNDANGQEIILAGSFNFRDEQDGTLGEDAFRLFTNAGLDSLIIAPATNFNFLGFMTNNDEDEVTSLPEVGENAPDYADDDAFTDDDGDLAQQTFTVNALTVENGSFNLAGHNIAVRGDVVFNTDRPLLNAQDEDDNLNGDQDEEVDNLDDLDADGDNDDGDDDNDDNDLDNDDLDNITVDLRISEENPFSELRFIGGNDANLRLAANYFVGDGIDIVIAKDDSDDTVTLSGGALLFDDAFDSFGDADDEFNEDTFDDEYLVLSSGILVAGDIADPNGAYVRLDHENRLFEFNPLFDANDPRGQVEVGATGDQGQGFIFDEADESLLTPQFPDSYINGNVRKRIISVQSDSPVNRRNPGNVIYPVGDMDGNYAEYVLDFQSIEQNQNFGLTSINVAFAAENPGGTRGLPLAQADGTTIDDVQDFYWLVTASPRLGANTFFSVQARYDGYELSDNLTIDELRLIRRQFGDASENEFTLVDGEYDNFLLRENGDRDPVVVAQDVEALLGRQGTIFAFGTDAGDRGTPVVQGPTVLPTELALKGNAPNPFRGRTTLAFDLPQASDVSVAVFDVMGRQVMALNGGTMAAGSDQTLEIDGSGLASGVYVLRLTAVGADGTPEVKTGQFTLAR